MTTIAEPSFRLLCVMAHHICDGLAPEASIGDVLDCLKWEIARAHLNNPPPHELVAVAEAVILARQKGYGTPR